MTSDDTPNNTSPLDQTPIHASIFGRTGSGKSKLVTQALIDELLNKA